MGKLNKLFGTAEIFSTPFPTSLIRNAFNAGINTEPDVLDYLDWTYKKTLEAKPTSVKNYFYSVAKARFNAENYKAEKRQAMKAAQKTLEREKTTCPVCGTEFNITEGHCPCCEFDSLFIKNADEIERHKKILSLSESKKAELKTALQKLNDEHGITSPNGFNLGEYVKHKKEVYEKYLDTG